MVKAKLVGCSKNKDTGIVGKVYLRDEKGKTALFDLQTVVNGLKAGSLILSDGEKQVIHKYVNDNYKLKGEETNYTEKKEFKVTRKGDKAYYEVSAYTYKEAAAKYMEVITHKNAKYIEQYLMEDGANPILLVEGPGRVKKYSVNM